MDMNEAEAVMRSLVGDTIECCGRLSYIPDHWQVGAHTLTCQTCRKMFVYREGLGWTQRVPNENCN